MYICNFYENNELITNIMIKNVIIFNQLTWLYYSFIYRFHSKMHSY